MKRFLRSKLIFTLVAVVLLAGAVAVPLSRSSVHTHAQGTVTFSEFPIPTSNSVPVNITSGPDGNLWFTEGAGTVNQIGKITPSGSITEYSIPTSTSSPYGITSGPDGNLWFTEFVGNKIGQITPSGTITEFPVPTSGSGPAGITAGPDGNLWFTEVFANNIGKITTGGAITSYPIPTSNSQPDRITSGPDGNLWFTEFVGNKIGRITPSGTITEFPVPTSSSDPIGITSGPDGNLWFTEGTVNQIGKITTSGTITEFPIPTSNSSPYGITSGPDGNLWFTEENGDQIGKITTSGTITEFPIPTSNSAPIGITSGPDGNLWFTEAGGNKIGRVNLSNTTPTPQVFQDFQGINFSQEVPSDSTGAVGLARDVELVNAEYAIYDRTNSTTLSITEPITMGRLSDLAGVSSNQQVDRLTDPQIIWDPQTSRFYFVVLDLHNDGKPNEDNFLIFGFSKTDSPNTASDWCTYHKVHQFFDYGSDIPDFPKLGDTQKFLMIGVNHFAPDEKKFKSADVNYISKPPVGDIAQCPDQTSFLTGLRGGLFDTQGSAWTPVPVIQTDSNSTGWILAEPITATSQGSDFLDLFQATEKTDKSGQLIALIINRTPKEVSVPHFLPPPNAEQKGTTFLLDTLGGRLTQAISAIDPSRQGMAIWTQHTVKHTDGKNLSEIHWYEIDPLAGALFPNGSGGVTSDTEYVFNGAISPDRAVNAGFAGFGDSMAIGFDTSSSAEDVAIRMVTKLGSSSQVVFTDSSFVPITQSPGPYFLTGGFAKCAPPPGACKWGDYSAATPDPAVSAADSHGNVWFTNMWNDASNDHSTPYWETWNWAVKF